MAQKFKFFTGQNFDPYNPEHRPPYIKGKGFCPNPIIVYGIPSYADSLKDKNVVDTYKYIEFWEEELRRIHNGYQTGGWWIPGCYYYYLNYSVMQDNRGGSINPDIDDLHMELAYLIDYCKKNGKNLMIPKARRKGISEATHKMVIDYGWRFTYNYKAGIASGKKDFIEDFVKKLRYGWMHLPPEFYTNPMLNNDDEIIAGYQEKNHLNSYVQAGTMNTIYTRTIHTDATGFKGNYYRDIIVEEIGETEKFLEFWRGTKSALTDGVGGQVGSAFCYGCVCAGTKVWDNKGRLVNIESLKKRSGILGFSGYGVSKEKIEWMKPPAQKPCYRITTTGNNYIECSEDHPLLWSHRYFKKGGKQIKKVTFKRACQVRVGDQLMLVDSVNVFGNKKIEHARFYGLMIGDGNATKGNCPSIGCCEPDIQNWIESRYYHTIHKRFTTKDGRFYKNYSLCGTQSILKEAGLYGLVKYDKRLPENIDEYDKESLSEILSGYFDADGNIKYHKKHGFRIGLTSVVVPLLEQVKFQLTKFGINSHIVTCKRSKVNKGFEGANPYISTLYICKYKSVLRFYENLKFLSKDKQSILDKVVSIPRKERMMADKCLFELNPENNKGLHYLNQEYLTGARHETVTSVEFIGMKDVYNLTAGTTHTYLANNFITSNTGGNMDKGSKDFKKAWSRNEKENFIDTNNFIRFLIPAQRFNIYGGAADPKRRIRKESKLLLEYQPYQLIGVEDVEMSLSDILKNRELLIKQSDKKDYYEHLQNEPINEQEIFAKTIVNNFNSELLSQQQAILDMQVHPKWTKYKIDWVKDKQGLMTMSVEVKALADGEDDSACVWILDDGHPVKNYQSRYCAGIDGYQIDESKNSKSLGGMCVLDRLTKTPVAVICCRPPRKEIFFELCIKLSIYYNMHRNVLGDLGSDAVMKHFELFGCYGYLADRPKKFESLTSDQAHAKWVRLTDYSKPKMIGLMQFHVNSYCHEIWFPELLSQIITYDEGAKDSDNDLADAYGIALMQDISFDIAPRDTEYFNEIANRFDLPVFKDGRIVGAENPITNIQQDTNLFKMMFGGDA